MRDKIFHEKLRLQLCDIGFVQQQMQCFHILKSDILSMYQCVHEIKLNFKTHGLHHKQNKQFGLIELYLHDLHFKISPYQVKQSEQITCTHISHISTTPHPKSSPRTFCSQFLQEVFLSNRSDLILSITYLTNPKPHGHPHLGRKTCWGNCTS